MFSLTSEEQHQVIVACAGVLKAQATKERAVFHENGTMFGMSKAQLQAQLARLFAVVAAIEARESDASQEEPPF